MTNQEIVNELANQDLIHTLTQNITHTNSENIRDLEQDIYLNLLQYDNKKLEKMFLNDELTFFIVRMISNNYYSTNSPYWKNYAKYDSLKDELKNNDDKDDIDE